jgi:glyoxylase-like metal-dependent hydrolase (beta-lactamase superfamily II)
MLLGDAIGRAVYIERLAWIPAFDVEPLESLETKRRIRDWAIEENVLLIFGHEVRMTMGYLRRRGEEFKVERVC